MVFKVQKIMRDKRLYKSVFNNVFKAIQKEMEYMSHVNCLQKLFYIKTQNYNKTQYKIY